MNVFKWIALFGFLSAIFSYLGIYAIYKKSNWVEKFKNYLLCFAAGILISTPFLITFPHAFEKKPDSGIFAIGGFVFLWFIDKVIYNFTKNKNEAFGIIGSIAIGFHSFVDGIIYTITFNASLVMGFLSATGLIFHEFAEGVITYTFLIAGGYHPKKAFIYAFIIAGLTTPFGAFVVYPLVSMLSKNIIPFLVSFVGGVLVYFSASHLIPEARESEEKHSSFAFFIGIMLVVVSSFYFHVH